MTSTGSVNAPLARGPNTCFFQLRELTGGYGCDVYIEATGAPPAVEQGLHMVRKLGTFVEFSVMREKVTVDWTIIGDTKELNVHGAHLFGVQPGNFTVMMITYGIRRAR